MAKILMIDDCADLLHYTAGILSVSGHEVLTAQNGYMGLQMAMREDPELVILDLHMPSMSGVALVKELRHSRAFDAVPILIYTSSHPKKYLEKIKAAGGNAWLQKSISSDLLLSTIDEFLGKRNGPISEEDRLYYS